MMKLLFITRKFPPMIGGMENLSYALAKEFSKNTDTTLITWGKSQKYLPFFIPLSFVKSLFLIPRKKITHVHIGDALLSPLGLILKYLFGVKTSITIMGLDIIFGFPAYQLIIPKCVARFDKVICISNATLEECVKRGIPREKCCVIPCGVYPEEFQISATRKDLEKILKQKLVNKKVLITVGRLVERKGVYWFIENVLPKLNNDFVYVVIGDGPEKERIQDLVKQNNLVDRVHLLGKISQDDLKIIYNTADLFIMPNIKTDGTMEGFGIVAIEASSTGLPVIAADIEGIRDAIHQGCNGYLVDAEQSLGFTHKIHKASLRKRSVKEYTKKNFDWENLGSQYFIELKFQ